MADLHERKHEDTVDMEAQHVNELRARKLIKQAITKYHSQLLNGCGRLLCPNENCQSSGKLPTLTSNEAAARAITCLHERAPFCEDLSEILDEEIVRSLIEECRKKNNWVWLGTYLQRVFGDSTIRNSADVIDGSTEQQLISQRKRRAEEDGLKLQLDTVTNVSANKNELEENRKYSRGESAPNSSVHFSKFKECASDSIELHSTQATQNSNDDNSESMLDEEKARCENLTAKTSVSSMPSNVQYIEKLLRGESPTDIVSARRCFRLLFVETEEHENYTTIAMDGIAQLCGITDFQLEHEKTWKSDPAGVIHIINLIFELPFVHRLEFIECGLLPLCKLCSNLPTQAQTILSSVWANFGATWIQDRVSVLQQAITLRILSVVDAVGSLPVFGDRFEFVPAAIQTMSILYDAVLISSKRNMVIPLGSRQNSRANRRRKFLPLIHIFGFNGSLFDFFLREKSFSDTGRSEEEDEEESTLAIDSPIDGWMVTKTCFPLTEMINTTLSENISVQDDFVAYKSPGSRNAFSVMPEYSFILTTEVKQSFLNFNNRILQRTERRQALADALTLGVSMEPYLRLNIRRDNIIRDALDNLAAIALDDSANFKKQLRIHFDGEQAVDEGGVSKEFYQLITNELFCPDYGMFISNENTGVYWFNAQCNFCDDEYGLIGILFGLAIYNNILIDVRFPTLVYVKLLARPAVFEELAQIDPVSISFRFQLIRIKDLYNGLRQLLECEDDVESIYNYTFQISYKDVYGNCHDEELVPNGAGISVTNANKEEFVAHYADFLLNRSVKRQFDKFSAGFNKVANQEILRKLFVPSEVEQLVCGILDLDFDVLAHYTKYQHGFSESSQTIKDFWTVAKAMCTEEKKMLLQFVTGSDRVPVGGLEKLDFVIARNGDDKERLPTAHTCYNVLLLPDYANLEITKERITKAISYSRGFGLQ
ncbi:unnamed protein product [Thelazia callipaeda]|uniref:HECT-type E3 ubiquitin transferase n=1 Tax=Thelazia callipaeda TaxID=103827 RepID=A0A0N5CX37_THECL|nr:unnamed protein product [Thelazia callipaeda]